MAQRNRSAAAKKGWKKRRAREAFEEERRQRGIAERQAEMPHFTAWLENAQKPIPLAGRVVKVDTAYADWEIDRQAAAKKRRLARERRAADKARAKRIVDAFCRPCEPEVEAVSEWQRFVNKVQAPLVAAMKKWLGVQ